MTEEKQLGVKKEDETSSGNNQPENKDTESETNVPDLEKEIDTIVGEQADEVILKDEDVEDLGDGTVALSKDKLEMLKKKVEDGVNYRKGLISIKSKLKETKKQKPALKKPEKADDNSEFVKKSDLDLKEQKLAIAEVEKNSVINQNWETIMSFYRNPGVGSSKEEYIKAVKQAFILWKNDTGYEEEEGEDADATSNLSTDKNKPSGDTTDEGKEKKRKSVLPKKQSVSEWYK